jgi:hypothetical protein
MTSGNWTGDSEFTSAVDFRVASLPPCKCRPRKNFNISIPSNSVTFTSITSHSFDLHPILLFYSPTLVCQYQITIPVSSSIERLTLYRDLRSVSSLSRLDVAKMRSQLLNTLAGALGFAALAASILSPQAYVTVLEFPWKVLILLSYGDDACVPSVSTVSVTISQATHTITLQQAPTSTVYVTLSASSAVEIGKVPTGTETRVNSVHRTTTLTPQPETVYITIPGSSQTEGGVTASSNSSPYYETTVTHYSHVTVTEVLTGPITSTTTVTGPLSFIEDNGTTSWFNGQAPDSTVSLVIVASVVTVVPLITPPSTITSTTTLKSTIFETHPVFLTETLSTKNTSSTSYYPISAGTGISFTGMASGGWNATSAASSSTQITPSAATSTTVISSAPTLVSPTRFALGVSSSVSTSSLCSSSSLSPYTNSTYIASASPISSASGLSMSTSVISTIAASTTYVSEASPTFPSPPAYASPTICGEVGDFTLNVSIAILQHIAELI